MASVGSFPGLTVSAFRRTERMPVNPMDKCTVVSIYPKHIKEKKITLMPGYFEILPGSYANPSLLTVGPSSWWREIDEDQPLLEIPNSSMQVANALVRDYSNGLIGCDMVNMMPGLFWLAGDISKEKLLKEYKSQLDIAKAKQDAWYRGLVMMADGLYARTGGNPIVVSEDMRMAARELGQDSKDWMSNFVMVANVPCVACGKPRNPNYPICPNCNAITDPEKAKSLGIVFATR